MTEAGDVFFQWWQKQTAFPNDPLTTDEFRWKGRVRGGAAPTAASPRGGFGAVGPSRGGACGATEPVGRARHSNATSTSVYSVGGAEGAAARGPNGAKAAMGGGAAPYLATPFELVASEQVRTEVPMGGGGGEHRCSSLSERPCAFARLGSHIYVCKDAQRLHVCDAGCKLREETTRNGARMIVCPVSGYVFHSLATSDAHAEWVTSKDRDLRSMTHRKRQEALNHVAPRRRVPADVAATVEQMRLCMQTYYSAEAREAVYTDMCARFCETLWRLVRAQAAGGAAAPDIDATAETAVALPRDIRGVPAPAQQEAILQMVAEQYHRIMEGDGAKTPDLKPAEFFYTYLMRQGLENAALCPLDAAQLAAVQTQVGTFAPRPKLSMHGWSAVCQYVAEEGQGQGAAPPLANPRAAAAPP